MVTKLFLKPHSLPILAFSSKSIFPHHHFLPLYFTLSFSIKSQSQSQFSDHNTFSYGPSLRHGTSPSSPLFRKPPIDHPQPLINTLIQNPDRKDLDNEETEEDIFNEDIFTRIFDLSALRVPSKDCFELENRLRGHLFNWPRIRNIARVPGDEIEDELVELVGKQNWNNSEDGDGIGVGIGIDSLHRRMYGKAEGDGESLSPVLYREKLVKTFDSRGYVKFKHLAKMSRPKKKMEKKEQGRDDGGNGNEMRRVGRNEFARVEVVESEEMEVEDMKGLLGDGFMSGKWRGSTRLLLLDERYADKGTEELPEAIKSLLKEDTQGSKRSEIELVRCRLSLYYDYWQMNEVSGFILAKGISSRDYLRNVFNA